MLTRASAKLEVFRQGKLLHSGADHAYAGPVKLPAVVLHMAKYPHNVGQAIRILSCYGVESLFVTGERVDLRPHDGYRLPREERMRGYGEVSVFSHPDPLGFIDGRSLSRPYTPVAVEMVPNAEDLPAFEHPANPVYIFGPEDGGLPGQIMKRCHRFIKIPTLHCLNLATAVGTVLYDRQAKL